MKFTKHDSAKARLDLLPADALELIGFVLRFGARKYAPNNWRKCKDPDKYISAMLRHAFKHLGKEEFCDSETGLPHLAHAVCSGLFALELFVQSEHTDSMGNLFYFAVLQKTSRGRGKILKRFRTYTSAWKFMTKKGLDLDAHTIKTVGPGDKVGKLIRI